MIETLGGILLAFVNIGYLVNRSFKRDDSDPPDGYSGLFIVTDYKTRVQYVGIPFCGLCVRVDAEGRPVTKPLD